MTYPTIQFISFPVLEENVPGWIINCKRARGSQEKGRKKGKASLVLCANHTLLTTLSGLFHTMVETKRR